ncbi:MAG TPA: SpoIIE family protein phosphatase [Thermoanaerobaculia bacterium]|nr:SpoIIE family protein phosphatase [Thermoanaerobaculia bacterium]
MSPSSRRLTGILIAVVLIAGTLGMAAWRLRVAHHRGWVGFVALPQKRSATKPEPPLPFGMRLGGVFIVTPGGPADRAGITTDDDIDAVNGVSTRDRNAVERIGVNARSGDVVVYRVRRHGVTRNVPVRFESHVITARFMTMLIVSLVVALVFFAIGLFIFWRDPVDRRAVLFFVMAVVATIYFISSAASYTESQGSRGVGSQQTIGMLPQVGIYVVALFLFAPLLLHLALVFPKPRPIVVNRPEILRWIYGPPAVALAAIAAAAVAGWASVHVLWLTYTICALAAVVILAAIVRIAMRVRRERGEAFVRQPLATQIAAIGILACSSALISHFITSVLGSLIAGGLAAVLMIASFLAYPIATVVALYRTYRESGVEEKRQVKWPLWATTVVLVVRIVCGSLGAFLAINWMFHGHGPISLMSEVLEFLPRLLYVLIPLAFAFAIVKYRLMNIDLIIRRTVTYAILSVVVFIVYGVLVAGVGTLLVRFAGVQNQTMVIASTIVVALVAVPLRNTLQRLVDRNVFRERVSHPLALRTLADAVGSGVAREDLLRLLAEQLQQALQNRVVLVAMRSDQHFVAAAKVGVADEILGSFRVPVAGIVLVRPLDQERDPLPLQLAQRLRRLGATLVVPMRAQRDAIGFVALGAKLSNDPFSAEDIEFIEAATTQAAMALETSRLRTEEVEFEQARAMQQVLLPTALPRLDGFDIAGMWQPARSVGGDYYDAIEVGDGKAALCIADVAGKGMSAALLMASLQAAVKATASADMPPSRVCHKVRQVVTGNLVGGTFITFFYALLDTAARTLTYCNAGHNPPLLVRADGEVERLDVGGSVLGRLFRAETYDEATVTLAAGDRVVLFTDGVSEARRGGEDFGDERLIDVVRANRELGAEELQEKIVEAITAFTSGSFGDDVTLVVIGTT